MVRRAREEGVSVSELIKKAVAVYLGKPTESTAMPNDKLKMYVQRVLQDLVNPFTAKVDEVVKRLSLVVERLDTLEDRVKGAEEITKELKTGGRPRHLRKRERRRKRPWIY